MPFTTFGSTSTQSLSEEEEPIVLIFKLISLYQKGIFYLKHFPKTINLLKNASHRIKSVVHRKVMTFLTFIAKSA
jgi:hypothetical protein